MKKLYIQFDIFDISNYDFAEKVKPVSTLLKA